MKKFTIIIGLLISVNSFGGLQFEDTKPTELDQEKTPASPVTCCGFSGQTQRIKSTPRKQQPKSKAAKKPAPIVVEKKQAPIVIEKKSEPQSIIINNNNVNTNTIYPQYIQPPVQAPVEYEEDDEPAPPVRKKKKRRAPVKLEPEEPEYDEDGTTSLYAHGGFFTRFRNFTGEVEARGQRFGLGLYVQHVSFYNASQDCVIMNGNDIGLDFHLHFSRLNNVRQYHRLDAGLYAQIGYGKYHLEADDRDFSALTTGFGVEVAFPFGDGVNAYARAGVNYLKNGKDWLYTGEQGSIGIRFDLD